MAKVTKILYFKMAYLHTMTKTHATFYNNRNTIVGDSKHKAHVKRDWDHKTTHHKEWFIICPSFGYKRASATKAYVIDYKR